jgi:hypothetical protein
LKETRLELKFCAETKKKSVVLARWSDLFKAKTQHKAPGILTYELARRESHVCVYVYYTHAFEGERERE